MPRVDVEAIAPKLASDYPEPFNAALAGREVRSVTKAGGIVDFNANHVVLPAGCQSSQRHWHEGEDELVVVLSGCAVLIDNAGERMMCAGDIATFPKNDGNGHVFINRSEEPCVLLAVSMPEASKVHYSDIDLIWTPDGGEQHRDGTPYPKR